MFLDEHGTISSDRDENVWGYGYCILPQANVASFEQELSNRFPNGLHLRTVRPMRRKVNLVRELAQILPESDFYGGGHVQASIDYGKQTRYRVLSGLNEDASHQQMMDVATLAAAAPIRSNGLIQPDDLDPDATKDSRLYIVYLHALKFPVLALRQIVEQQTDLHLEVVAGFVANEEAHKRQIARLRSELERNVTNSYQHFR